MRDAVSFAGADEEDDASFEGDDADENASSFAGADEADENASSFEGADDADENASSFEGTGEAESAGMMPLSICLYLSKSSFSSSERFSLISLKSVA